MIKISHNGRPFDPERFAEEIEAKAIEAGMRAFQEKLRGAASAIIDPETGQYADVFVDRMPGNRVAIRTNGSPAFARLLEQRVGIGIGEVGVVTSADVPSRPKVYLAHASEDKALVRPIAEYLMAKGVDVWFDEWEIEPGDSLRQKMEEGLGAMTHFVVVLTPASINKPWVAKEIDVGMVRQIGGASGMVPLVVGLDHQQLSPFFQAMLCLPIDPENDADLQGLVDQLHGVSRKPALGEAPKYVQSTPAGLSGWSQAAIAIGRHLVKASLNAMPRDPIKSVEDLAAEIGLSLEEVRLAVLDLKEAGYLWEGAVPGRVAADTALFVDFDEVFMPFSPAKDAHVVANYMITSSGRATNTQNLAEALNWPPRRINSAICYLQRAGAIEARHALASTPWRAVQLIQTDRTLRFARIHA